jgi:predicted ATPase/class 3 adenylate cyclase
MDGVVELPEGVVTFLFTDIEGSTRLLQENEETFKTALARHNALLSEAIEQHRGHVFETVGDAYYAVFAHAVDAVGAAIAAQAALGEETWSTRAPIRARVALHTGDVERRGTKYFGSALFRSSRLLSAAHGGQILLSGTTAALVLDSLPDSSTLKDLGEHRLRDLNRPEHIWQVSHPRIPSAFPPLRSLSTLPNNLPAQLTTFVGRSNEIAEVRRLMATTRLFTLTGSGGAGKTRLSIQVGAELLHDYPDGVWFVEFAPLADGDLVAQAIAHTLGLRQSPPQPILATLLEHLREKRMLVILDNCEHLVASCARVADTLLRSCPDIHLLATSRQALGLPGEVCWRVPSLAVPMFKQALPVEQVTQYDAVRLFIDRAVAVVPGFTVTSRNAPAVAQICWRLDGIPLAIELAASRVRALTVEQISARLDDRFKLLTGGSRAALPRQQTLRALIDWSYDLLSDDERTVFRRLAVFSGGFTLEAAEAVCSEGLGEDAPSSSLDVLDLLTQLVEKSLVIVEEVRDATRYVLLESVRQYALERLAACGELAVVQRHHAAYFVELADTAESLLLTHQRSVWMARMEAEYDNLRAIYVAARNAGSTGTSEEMRLALRLVAALCWFWVPRGTQPEGLEWVEAILAQADDNALAERAKALTTAGILATFSGQTDLARTRLAEAIDAWRALGQSAGLARSLVLAGAMDSSDTSAVWERRSIMEGARLFRDIGDDHSLAVALRVGGILAYIVGDRDVARELTEEAVRHLDRLRDLWFVAQCLNSLGDFARGSGDDLQAAEFYRKTLEICRQQDFGGMTPSVLQNLAFVALRQGEPREALRSFGEGLAIFQSNNDRRGIAECLGGMAAAYWAMGRADVAARLIGTTEAALTASGALMWPANRSTFERTSAEVRRHLGESAFASACGEGQRMTLDQAVAFALAPGATSGEAA